MIALIGCSKTKKNYNCSAKEMYSQSVLFSKTLRFCLNRFCISRIKIVSAKYGLLSLEDTIEPYELSLKMLNKSNREKWGLQIAEKLNNTGQSISFYCGSQYIKYITPSLIVPYGEPLKGMQIGERLSFLSE